jgi:sulfite exporter TauE/SafE
MWPLVTSVALASLVGSVHCAGMCGPFAVLVARGEDRLLGRELAYHSGRLISYSLLGLAAGAAGAALDLSGAAFGLQRAALFLAGAGLVAFGLLSLLRQFGVLLPRPEAGGPLGRLATRAQRLALQLPPARRAWAVGLATGLLPCGWLYAFALTAAASGSPLGGAAVMAVFWIGSVPALVAVSLSARRLLGRFERRAPALGAMALVVLGSLALTGRMRVPALDAAGVVVDPLAAAHQVDALDPERSACCSAEGEAADASR